MRNVGADGSKGGGARRSSGDEPPRQERSSVSGSRSPVPARDAIVSPPAEEAAAVQVAPALVFESVVQEDDDQPDDEFGVAPRNSTIVRTTGAVRPEAAVKPRRRLLPVQLVGIAAVLILAGGGALALFESVGPSINYLPASFGHTGR